MAKKIMTKVLSFSIPQQDYSNTIQNRRYVLPQYVDEWKALDLLWKKSTAFRTASITPTLQEILLKVSTLNYFYSTGIMDVYPVAKHIYDLYQKSNLQVRLANGDPTAVADIAKVKHNKGGKGNGTIIRHTSFASKYANWENPCKFPIMDDFVVKVFSALREKKFFYGKTFIDQNNGIKKSFSQSGLKDDYHLFKSVYDTFITLSGMDNLTNSLGQSLTYRDIDRYLWSSRKVKNGGNTAKVITNNIQFKQMLHNTINSVC